VLRRVLTTGGTLLEIGSGTGQHAAFFAAALPTWTYVPSDPNPENLSSIEAYRATAQLPNLQAPVPLDVLTSDWAWSERATSQLDAIFSANMIHIAPWECCEALMRGAAKYLRAGGQLILYGPFRVGGAHVSESNREFDADLRARDARWGVRDLEVVAQLGSQLGLLFCERIDMPANNLCLRFERSQGAGDDVGDETPPP
jgi:cyclopropane fatty-acyl-phospholipid synthase-like methyltransferase